MKELIASNIGEEDVGPTVIVVVPDSHATAIARSLEPRPFSHVGKSAIAVVVEEPVPVNRRLLDERGDLRATDEVDVEIAVTVIVEQGYPGDHGLWLVLAVCICRRGYVIQAGLCSDLFKSYLA